MFGTRPPSGPFTELGERSAGFTELGSLSKPAKSNKSGRTCGVSAKSGSGLNRSAKDSAAASVNIRVLSVDRLQGALEGVREVPHPERLRELCEVIPSAFVIHAIAAARRYGSPHLFASTTLARMAGSRLACLRRFAGVPVRQWVG